MTLFKQDATSVCLYVFTALLLAAAAAQPVYAQDEHFAFEAEAGTLRGDMGVYPDPAASGGLLLKPANLDSFSLYVVNALNGRYVVWARVLATSTSQNEFLVSVDGGVTEDFVIPSPSPNYQWLLVNGTSNPRYFDLTQGVHTFKIAAKEAEAGLDQIIITKNLFFNPNTTTTTTDAGTGSAGSTGSSTPAGSSTSSGSTTDTTPPTVSVAAPTQGQSVSGTISVNANATDNVGVVGVQFQLDGSNLGSEDMTSPYSVSWNTAAYPGSHDLTAIARDQAGNITTSSSVLITVPGTTTPNTAPNTGSDFYVSPNATSSGTGSLSNPWTLTRALSQPSNVVAGSTIWMRGGTYKGSFVSNLRGSTSGPIVVRSYPGEWARLEGMLTTTITVGMDTSSGTITLQDANGFKQGDYINIENEQIYLHTQSGNTFVCLRGWNGTPVTSHAAGTVLSTSGSMLTVNGSDTIFRDFEVLDSHPTRSYWAAGDPSTRRSGDGVYVYGQGIKLVNLVIHDAQDGVFLAEVATDTEAYGLIIYNNGHVDTGRGQGIGMYIQNNVGTKRVTDVIAFNNFAAGMKGFGESGFANNLEFQGVMSFNNGSPATFPGNPANEAANFRATNLFVGSAVNSNRNILVSNSYAYHKWDTMVDMATMGFGYISGGTDLTVTNNYIAGGRQALRMAGFSNARVTGNTIFGSLSTVYMDTPNGSSFTWDNNAYFDNSPIDSNTGGRYSFQFNKTTNKWGGGTLTFDEAASGLGKGWRQWTGYDAGSSFSVGKPTGLKVFVRPNAWEQGRAHVAIFNWGQASTVSINLSSSGLLDGDPFEIRDVQNYFGAPVYTGTYSSGSPSVSIPIGSLSTVEPPIGLGFTPAHTAPEFAVLVVKKR